MLRLALVNINTSTVHLSYIWSKVRELTHLHDLCELIPISSLSATAQKCSTNKRTRDDKNSVEHDQTWKVLKGVQLPNLNLIRSANNIILLISYLAIREFHLGFIWAWLEMSCQHNVPSLSHAQHKYLQQPLIFHFGFNKLAILLYYETRTNLAVQADMGTHSYTHRFNLGLSTPGPAVGTRDPATPAWCSVHWPVHPANNDATPHWAAKRCPRCPSCLSNQSHQTLSNCP